jgi:hypothetical protein
VDEFHDGLLSLSPDSKAEPREKVGKFVDDAIGLNHS